MARFMDGDVELIMDALTYGENLSSCESDLKEGDAATAPPEGQSLSRCPDGDDYDDNSDDFATTLNPTPGEENTCPARCSRARIRFALSTLRARGLST